MIYLVMYLGLAAMKNSTDVITASTMIITIAELYDPVASYIAATITVEKDNRIGANL